MTSDRKMLALLAMGAALAVVLVAVIGTLIVNGDDDEDAATAFEFITETVTETVVIEPDPAEEPGEPAGPASVVPGDGVYEVGRDMRPGRYRSVENFGCYWQISRDPNGDDLVSNDNVDGASIVDVKRGQFFTSQGCSDWTRD